MKGLKKELIAGLLLMGVASAGFAVEAGIIKTVSGKVSIERAGQTISAVPGTIVESADRVITAAASNVGITLRDDTLLSAGPNSVLNLDRYAFDSTTYEGTLDASIKRGTLAVISGKIAKQNPNAVTFRTPTSTLGVRGTEFIIEVNGE